MVSGSEPAQVCPLCDRAMASRREFAVHLEDAHGLTDDAGSAPRDPEPVRATAVPPVATQPESFASPRATADDRRRMPWSATVLVLGVLALVGAYIVVTSNDDTDSATQAVGVTEEEPTPPSDPSEPVVPTSPELGVGADQATSDDSANTVEVVEAGYHVEYSSATSSWIVRWAAVIRNNDPVLWSGLNRLQVTVTRPDGSILATDSPSTGFLPPGQALPDVGYLSLAEEPGDLSFEITDVRLNAGPSAEQFIPFEVLDVQRVGDDFTGRVVNPYSGAADVEVVVIVRQAGQIVWGESTFADSLGSGEARAWSIQPLQDVPDGDVEVVAGESSPVGWADLAAG